MADTFPPLHTLLLPWYEQYGRHNLPWQINANPYKVWLSEIMLQQTQVATVIPYFQRFLEDFPTLKDLAAAKQDDVLARWAGLGYYARGRNLHKAAQMCVEQHNGELPQTPESLVELPGIGESTASAIASFAYGIKATILDGNVKRVLTRCFAMKGDPNKTPLKPELWEIAKAHTPDEGCAKYNQAIMDIGATVCTRTKPNCHVCPINAHCQAFNMGTPTAFPDKSSPIKKSKETIRFVVPVTQDGQLGLAQRPAKGIWAKLWCFPELDSGEQPDQWATKVLKATPIRHYAVEPFQHVLTHKLLTIETHVVLIQKAVPMDGLQWQPEERASEMGIPKPVAKILKQLFRQREIV